MLQRSDLPDDPQAYDGVVDTAQWNVSDAFPGTRARRGRLAKVLSVLAAVLVALAIAVGVWVATAATGRTSGMTVAVIAGVPGALLVVALLAGLAGHRRR
jgi:hypothetical protein